MPTPNIDRLAAEGRTITVFERRQGGPRRAHPRGIDLPMPTAN
jgi:hypothetical protein